MNKRTPNPYLEYLGSFKKNHRCKYNCVSLFSGGGGLDLGAYCAGFESRFVSDVKPAYTATIKRNLSHVTVYNDDAMQLTGAKIREMSGIKGEIDLTIAGPPCQSFSIMGKRDSLNDPRGQLTIKYFDLIAALRPRAFLFENVPGLLTVNGGKDFSHLWKFIQKKTRYILFKAVLKATDFGVPQIRERLFIIGFRPDVDSNGFKFPDKCSAKKSIGLSIPVPSGLALEKVEGLPNHEIRVHTSEVVERFKKVLQGKRDRGSYCDRIDPKLPSHTILIGSSVGGARPHIHPTKHRVLTVREAARIQSFPDWYEFGGGRTEQYRQVGNAVPPLLAYEVVRQIKKVLDAQEKHA